MIRSRWILLVVALLASVGCLEKTASPPAAASEEGSRAAASEGSSSAMVARGRELYMDRCVECHGREGKGDGPAADLLHSHPPNFARGLFPSRGRSGEAPSTDDLIRSLNAGPHGKTMPGWRDLTDDDRRAILVYLQTIFPMSA